jgi:phenylpropionate dioxygenase-like ring-hydroxylating dioxygenase large terminal subunit
LSRFGEIHDNFLHDLGHVGLFHHGSVGARVHHNVIDGTSQWDELWVLFIHPPNPLLSRSSSNQADHAASRHS